MASGWRLRPLFRRALAGRGPLTCRRAHVHVLQCEVDVPLVDERVVEGEQVVAARIIHELELVEQQPAALLRRLEVVLEHLERSGLFVCRCVAKYTLALAPLPSLRPRSSWSSRSEDTSPASSGLAVMPFWPMVKLSCEKVPVSDMWKEPCFSSGMSRRDMPPGFLSGMAAAPGGGSPGGAAGC